MANKDDKIMVSVNQDKDDREFDISEWLASGKTNKSKETDESNNLIEEIADNFRLRHLIGFGGILVLAVVPFITSISNNIVITRLLFLMMFAMSWDIVSGYTGQVSLGHAFFFAIGGYSTAALNVHLGLSPISSISVSLLMGILSGLLLGVPALRVRGPFLALLTLIAPFLLLRIFIFYSHIFGGTDGFTPLPDPLVGTTDSALLKVSSFESVVFWDYYITYFLFLLILLTLLAYTRGGPGQVLTSIRQNEQVTNNIGINSAKFKLSSFLLSAIIGSLAGAFYVHSIVGSPHPGELLNLELSLNVIIFSVLGGIGTIVGPIIGVLIFFIFQFVLEQITFTIPLINMTLDDLQPIPLFLLTILTIIYMRGGILRWSIRTADNIPFNYYTNRIIKILKRKYR